MSERDCRELGCRVQKFMGEIEFLFSSSLSEGDLATCFTQFKIVSLLFIRENRLQSLYFFSLQWLQVGPPILNWPGQFPSALLCPSPWGGVS